MIIFLSSSRPGLGAVTCSAFCMFLLSRDSFGFLRFSLLLFSLFPQVRRCVTATFLWCDGHFLSFRSRPVSSPASPPRREGLGARSTWTPHSESQTGRCRDLWLSHRAQPPVFSGCDNPAALPPRFRLSFVPLGGVLHRTQCEGEGPPLLCFPPPLPVKGSSLPTASIFTPF